MTSRRSLRSVLIGLPRPTKSAITVGTDFVGFLVCAFLAYWLVSGEAADFRALAPALLAVPFISVFIAWLSGLYRSVVRYVGLDLVFGASKTAAFASALAMAFNLAFPGAVFSLRWVVACAVLSFMYVCASRYFARLTLLAKPKSRSAEAVIVYGAGAAGAQLISNLRLSGLSNPVAILDDDESLHGKTVCGLVVHPPSDLDWLIESGKVGRVLLAIPRASRRRRRQILEYLTRFPVHVQTIPDFKDIVSGKASVDEIQEVEVTDLLGRDPVPPNPELMRACVSGKSVMVTGAGGSIGAELCRQIIRLNPSRLVLFELSEPALYSVDRKLQKLAFKKGIDVEIIALLGSVHHEQRVREVLRAFDVKTVYHAAAYKHVPIVEQNVFEGIHNNILGTLHTVKAAIDVGVDDFVLISTDKAVNPTNVMGATKRFAELILQAYNAKAPATTLSIVRFGNVLESSGSVVPLFKEQIRSGGPVTVTHPEIIRYFMTIPEASQLVIQAGAMARGGDVFVLDMGKPVKIRDLARRMISLMGLTMRDAENPDGDIEIKYVGLRPAEKLYEELLIGAKVSGTDHPRIMRADEDFLPLESLLGIIEQLREASASSNYSRARELLLTAIKEYAPSNGIDDLVWVRKTGTSDTPQSENVVDFPPKKR